MNSRFFSQFHELQVPDRQCAVNNDSAVTNDIWIRSILFLFNASAYVTNERIRLPSVD